MVKVEVVDQYQEKITKYPCLGICVDDGLVVLFTRENIGTVLKSANFHRVGHHDDTWVMSYFTPFKGELKLSNG